MPSENDCPGLAEPKLFLLAYILTDVVRIIALAGVVVVTVSLPFYRETMKRRKEMRVIS